MTKKTIREEVMEAPVLSPEEKIEEVIRKSSERRISSPDDELETNLAELEIPVLLEGVRPENKSNVSWNNSKAISELDRISKRHGDPNSLRSEAGGVAIWKDFKEFVKLCVHDTSHVHLYPWPHFDVVHMTIDLSLDEKQQRKLHKISQALDYNSSEGSVVIRTDSWESAVGLAVLLYRFSRGKCAPHECRHMVIHWADRARLDNEFLKVLERYLAEVRRDARS